MTEAVTSIPVSVVIPTYNRAASLERAIASVLQQTRPPREIIVVDDASRDATPQLAYRYGRRVRFIFHEENKGAAAARNTGIGASRQPFVAFLDSDDVWHPEKLEQQLGFIRDHAYGICCTKVQVHNGREGEGIPLKRPYRDSLGLDEMLWGCFVSPGTSMMAERKLLLNIGCYDEQLRRLEDWDMLLRLGYLGQRIGYLNQALATVWPSGQGGSEAVAESIARIEEKHLSRVRKLSKAAASRLRSGLAFERAAYSFNRGDRLSGLGHLLASFYHAPVGNQAFGIILWPRIKQMLRG